MSSATRPWRAGSTRGAASVLNPWLWCTPRGIEPLCEACAAGRYPWCRNFRNGDLPVAIHLGNCAGAAGVHAERFCAHESQLFEVPDELWRRRGRPVRPGQRLAALDPPQPPRNHRAPPSSTGRVRLAFAAIGLLRHLYPALEIWAATRPGFRASLAARLGADAVLSSAPDKLVAEVARAPVRPPLKPWSGKDWLQDGPGVVYDTIGSTETVETSLRLVHTRRGTRGERCRAAQALRVDADVLQGDLGHRLERLRHRGGRRRRKHAFEHYFDFARAGLDLTAVVTHRFPLARWDEAVLTLADSRRTGAVKVLLEP